MKKSLRNIALLVIPLVFGDCCPSHGVGQPAAQNQKTPAETVKILQNLTQYEIDASFLVSQCMDNVKNQALKDKLLRIKGECEEGIKELATLVRKYGGEVPDYSKDFKGYFMEGYAAMRGVFTDQGALKALHTNLKLILKSFESALNSSLPTDAKEVIRKVYENKIKALQSVESQI